MIAAGVDTITVELDFSGVCGPGIDIIKLDLKERLAGFKKSRCTGVLGTYRR